MQAAPRRRIAPQARAFLIGAAVLGLGIIPIRSDAASFPSAAASVSLPASAVTVFKSPTAGKSVHIAELNVYADTLAGFLNSEVAGMPERVYVPNSTSGTVDVIDPATFQIVAHYQVGNFPHHVAPSWDLRHLYVDTEGWSALTVIDPMTTKITGRIPLADPYNLYFTPDGTRAIVVAERLHRLDFRDPITWQLQKSVAIPWLGVDHLDFTADGRYLLASTEYSGVLVKVDVQKLEIAGTVRVGGLPIDVRLSPDGSVFYVANQGRSGVSIIDPVSMTEVGFIHTGRGAHGLQISRDTKYLYVSNRYEGSISLIDFATRQLAATWHIGGSPDMLQVSPDGSQLWASGRFDASVYVVDTTTGHMIHRIRVGGEPHGLCYFPNVGRYSLGHNGVYR
jgi:YVTN family beta-propeller protein